MALSTGLFRIKRRHPWQAPNPPARTAATPVDANAAPAVPAPQTPFAPPAPQRLA